MLAHSFDEYYLLFILLVVSTESLTARKCNNVVEIINAHVFLILMQCFNFQSYVINYITSVYIYYIY
jgi:hypothetical protein